MPSSISLSSSPDYLKLIKFLIGPFLEDPSTLSVDLERCNQDQRVWVRLAFDEADKGKVFGRGGRNLQAIRSVLETAATIVGQSIHLEVYETEGEAESRRRSRSSDNGDGMERRPNNQKPRAPRPINNHSRF